MFLGSLCLLRHVISIASKKTVLIEKGLTSLIIPLVVMMAVACCSLIMPIIIDGDLKVLNAHEVAIYFAEPQPLYFSFQYATQFAYFLFGCLLACYFAIKNSSPENLHRSIQIYLYATLFVCCWGIVEFVLFFLNIPYPSFIFNGNLKSMNVAGTVIQTGTGMPRISSVSLEPSIMSQQLLTVIPLLFWQVWERGKYLSKPNPKYLLFLTVLVLLISTAASAWLGLFMFILIVIIHYLQQKRISQTALTFIAIGVVTAICATPFVIQGLSGKLSSYSGIERFRAYTEGWSYFFRYPILGIGWGVFPVWDLVTCIAVATGIVGLFISLWLLVSIYRNFRKLRRSGNYSFVNRSIWHSFLLLLAISQASGFIYHSQYFWLVLGLTMAASVKKTQY